MGFLLGICLSRWSCWSPANESADDFSIDLSLFGLNGPSCMKLPCKIMPPLFFEDAWARLVPLWMLMLICLRPEWALVKFLFSKDPGPSWILLISCSCWAAPIVKPRFRFLELSPTSELVLFKKVSWDSVSHLLLSPSIGWCSAYLYSFSSAYAGACFFIDWMFRPNFWFMFLFICLSFKISFFGDFNTRRGSDGLFFLLIGLMWGSSLLDESWIIWSPPNYGIIPDWGVGPFWGESNSEPLAPVLEPIWIASRLAIC